MTSIVYGQELFSTGQGGELVTGVPCGKSQAVANRRVIYEIYLGRPLVEGEYLDFNWHGQFTNDLKKYPDIAPKTDSDYYTVGLWCGVIISDSSGQADTIGDALTEEMTEENGRNITPNTHHDERGQSDFWVPPASWDYVAKAGFQWVKVVAAAASSAAPAGTPPPFSVTVDQDYGRLSVKINSPIIG